MFKYCEKILIKYWSALKVHNVSKLDYEITIVKSLIDDTQVQHNHDNLDNNYDD